MQIAIPFGVRRGRVRADKNKLDKRDRQEKCNGDRSSDIAGGRDTNPADRLSGAGFQGQRIESFSGPSRNFTKLAGFQAHNDSLLHKQMAGRDTWCHRTLERGLEQCSPTLKYVTCTQSLPWPKS